MKTTDSDTEFSAASAGNHAAGADAVAHAVWIPLAELGVLRASGPDAASFLQSQLTNEVVQQPADHLFLSGYCTPKGRLLATFHQWRDGEDVLLRTPADVIETVAKRLQMYVLRSKAKIADAAANRVAALLGPGAADALRAAQLPVPDRPWQHLREGTLTIDRLAASPVAAERFLLTGPPAAWPPALEALPGRSAQFWWWTEIRAALPTVFAATQQKFVPQMLNYEVVGGVSFKKGCYPGQEIVARSQYLGKLKRRMRIAAVAAAPPAPGADVYRGDNPVGTVVMAAAAPGGGTELLFEAPLDAIESGELHLGSEATRLDILPLPYALFDPTA